MQKGTKIFALILAVSCAVVSVGCGKGKHVHTYSEQWYYDETYHWQIPTCGDTDEVGNKSVHNFVRDVCHLCGYSRNENTQAEFYDVTYGVEGIGGTIKGDKTQRVKNGGDASPVEAVPDEGYLFVMWSDGEIKAQRQDRDIGKNLNLLAVFEPDPDNPDIDDDEDYGNDHPDEEESDDVHKGTSSELDGLIFTEMKSIADDSVMGYSVRMGTSQKSNIEIPATFQEQPVLEIEDNAFENSSIKRIVIPTSVTKIGHQSFMNCTSLQEIDIPDNVLDVGNQAFQGCISLAKVRLSAQMKGVWYKMFYRCASLAEIELPDSVESVGRYAFYNCQNLKRVQFGTGMKKCGAKAFQNCVNLKKLEIPNLRMWCEMTFDFFMQSLRSTFESNPLYYAHELYIVGEEEPVRDLNIPEGTAMISAYAFYDCTCITKLTVPASVRIIGKLAFCGCSNLESVDMEEGLISMEYGIFEKCTALKRVNFPDSLQKMGEDNNALEKLQQVVFASCPALTEVTFGTGLEKLDCIIFTACGQLANVTYRGTAAQWEEIVCPNWASQCAPELTVHCLGSHQDILYAEKWVVENSVRFPRYEKQSITDMKENRS